MSTLPGDTQDPSRHNDRVHGGTSITIARDTIPPDQGTSTWGPRQSPDLEYPRPSEAHPPRWEPDPVIRSPEFLSREAVTLSQFNHFSRTVNGQFQQIREMIGHWVQTEPRIIREMAGAPAQERRVNLQHLHDGREYLETPRPSEIGVTRRPPENYRLASQIEVGPNTGSRRMEHNHSPSRDPRLLDMSEMRRLPNQNRGFASNIHSNPLRRSPSESYSSTPSAVHPGRRVPIMEVHNQPQHRPGSVIEEKNPLAGRILSTPLPRRFKMPTLPTFDGLGDPQDHIQCFKGILQIQGADDALLCRAFPITLTKVAREWYCSLPDGSVTSFSYLSQAFCSQFIAGRKRKWKVDHLLNVKQRPEEALRDYVRRFNEERLNVEGCTEDLAIAAFKTGVTHEKLHESLHLQHPHNMDQLLNRADKFIALEELTGKNFHKKTIKGKDPPRDRKAFRRNNRGGGAGLNARDEVNFTKLNTSRCLVLVQSQKDGYLHRPPPKTKGKQDPTKYCIYHRANGHDTEDCAQLKRDIEALIRRGHLLQYVAKDKREDETPQRGQIAAVTDDRVIT